MLTRLDQLPHQVFQLIVSLDQIAEVRIQHVLINNNKVTRWRKHHFIMSIQNTCRRAEHKTPYIHNDVWRGRWLVLVCSENRFYRLMLISNIMWQTPRPSSTKPTETGGEGRGDKELLTRIWNYKTKSSPSAAYVSIINAAISPFFKLNAKWFIKMVLGKIYSVHVSFALMTAALEQNKTWWSVISSVTRESSTQHLLCFSGTRGNLLYEVM